MKKSTLWFFVLQKALFGARIARPESARKAKRFMHVSAYKCIQIKLLEFLSQLNHLWYLVLQIKNRCCLHCALHFPKHGLEQAKNNNENEGWTRTTNWRYYFDNKHNWREWAVVCRRGISHIFTLGIRRIFAWLHKSCRHRRRHTSLRQGVQCAHKLHTVQLYTLIFSG